MLSVAARGFNIEWQLERFIIEAARSRVRRQKAVRPIDAAPRGAVGDGKIVLGVSGVSLADGKIARGLGGGQSDDSAEAATYISAGRAERRGYRNTRSDEPTKKRLFTRAGTALLARRAASS